MDEEARKTFADEVDSRLEDLFGEDEKPTGEDAPSLEDLEIAVEADPAEEVVEALLGKDEVPTAQDLPEAEPGGTAGETSPLRELRSMVLSIDWEITDEVMGTFLDQVESLKGAYGQDRWASLLLQGLSSLGRYIRRRKGKAHPNSINVLKSLYGSLEKVVLPGKADEDEKKRIVARELERFRELKKDVAVGRGRAATVLQRPALEEIKEVIRSEFAKLRAELRSMLQGKSD
ncbi:MAG: hypothetical protein JRF59_01145 [Deltaproteobacteria bacterium]|nr:hypothetical protein [Deltaproteobacteria bacterium]MBW1922342.1 hypothetical protein [Deltaproteobacteria bacterium]MBW1948094.1 hypothetical protein [Deltaproteobacteria bacterium]MBW2006519.1 hypothetical protein [Deltaproteobacteria bacterium]MBW2101251.1 hypothetical protein [Deltaproteobacteria bacterium]